MLFDRPLQRAMITAALTYQQVLRKDRRRGPPSQAHQPDAPWMCTVPAVPLPSEPPCPAATERVVSVRALCAFAARSGDLDLRFTPAPTASQGMAGHQRVQSRRPAHFQREVGVSCRRAGLLVRGRADGFDALRPRLEEIKTYRGPFDGIRGNQRALHWAQAKVYAAMLCEQHDLERIEIVLVYLDLDCETETTLVQTCCRAELLTLVDTW